jgi:hypothetical protein
MVEQSPIKNILLIMESSLNAHSRGYNLYAGGGQVRFFILPPLDENQELSPSFAITAPITASTADSILILPVLRVRS